MYFSSWVISGDKEAIRTFLHQAIQLVPSNFSRNISGGAPPVEDMVLVRSMCCLVQVKSAGPHNIIYSKSETQSSDM